jgi:hypothetical protein
MNHVSAEPDEAVECASTVNGLIERIASGRAPFDEMDD